MKICNPSQCKWKRWFVSNLGQIKTNRSFNVLVAVINIHFSNNVWSKSLCRFVKANLGLLSMVCKWHILPRFSLFFLCSSSVVCRSCSLHWCTRVRCSECPSCFSYVSHCKISCIDAAPCLMVLDLFCPVESMVEIVGCTMRRCVS